MSITNLPESKSITHEADEFWLTRVPDIETTGRHTVQAGVIFNEMIYLCIISYPEGTELPGRARIFCYSPTENTWSIVYGQTIESQIVTGKRGDQQLPVELGFRSITVMDGRIYVSLVSLRQPKILVSDDGAHFKEMLADRPAGTPFGPLVAYKGKLFAAPVGTISSSKRKEEGRHCQVYVCNNPEEGTWQLAAPPDFDDDSNQVIHGLGVYCENLYAFVGNGLHGFQIWKTGATGTEPYQWELVVDRGAQRFTLNSSIASFAVFNNKLYIGTGTPATEPLAENQAASEILRISADDKWELIMGNPRFSPHGLQIPASAHSAGFDCKTNHHSISLLSVHEGHLYAGLNINNGTGNTLQIWRSKDGESWEIITTEQPNNKQFSENRLLLATANGLLLA